MLQKKEKNRFWNKVIIAGVNDCWLWDAGKTKFGYGVFSLKGKWIGAHVVSFMLYNKYKPQLPKMVMHDCQNPSCVNPKHLIEGTAKENGNYSECIRKCQKNIKTRKWFGAKGKDHFRYGKKHTLQTKEILRQLAVKRGGWHKGLKRSNSTKEKLSLLFRGENSPKAKLTEKEVLEIFIAVGKQATIAKQYNIDPSTVSNIKRRKIWCHLFRNPE
jgi:arsenate reductase-like glutaredoxin family protein